MITAQSLLTIFCLLTLVGMPLGSSNEADSGRREGRSRVTVILFGQTVCSDLERQFLAIHSQLQSLFKALHLRGFEVRGVLATNDCGRTSQGVSWEHEVRRHYGAALHALALVNCTGFLEQRCLAYVSFIIQSFNCAVFENIHTPLLLCLRVLQRALRLYDEMAHSPQRGDVVILTRPDIAFKERGYELTTDIVRACSPRYHCQ